MPQPEFFCQADTDLDPGRCQHQCDSCKRDVERANASGEPWDFLADEFLKAA